MCTNGILQNGVLTSVRREPPLNLLGTIDIGTNARLVQFSSEPYLLPGDRVLIKGAGAGGDDLATTIVSVPESSPWSLTIADDASTSITNSQVIYEAFATDRILQFATTGYGQPSGWYCMDSSTTTTDATWSVIPNILNGALLWDPSALTTGSEISSPSITVVGAALGDSVLVGAPYDLQGIICIGYVSGINTVIIRLRNGTGGTIDLDSGTWRVRVLKS